VGGKGGQGLVIWEKVVCDLKKNSGKKRGKIPGGGECQKRGAGEFSFARTAL